MKKLLIVPVICYLLTSCVAIHTGSISSSSIGKTVKYEDIACGVSQTDRLFGLGSLSQDALVLEAKREMIKNRPLMPDEEYANYTLDFKNTYWPFYIQNKVTMCTDVVRFTNDNINDPYSEKYKMKLVGVIISNELFAIGDSIIDEKFNEATIISLQNDKIARIMYKTGEDKIRTKKISIEKIYSKNKSYKGHATGGMYIYTDNGRETSGRIIAVGLNSIIIRNSEFYKKIQILDYNE